MACAIKPFFPSLFVQRLTRQKWFFADARLGSRHAPPRHNMTSLPGHTNPCPWPALVWLPRASTSREVHVVDPLLLPVLAIHSKSVPIPGAAFLATTPATGYGSPSRDLSLPRTHLPLTHYNSSTSLDDPRCSSVPVASTKSTV